MAIEIFFSGLICHSGNDSGPSGDRATKTHAILVNDPDHTAYITIKSGNTVTTTTAPLSIAFGAANYGARATDQAFGRCVPHLADLSATDVYFIFGNGLDVQLPAGSFYVASYFDKGSTFTLGSETTSKACVARFTLLELDDDTITVSVDSGSPQLLKDGDWVYIENASNSTIAVAGDHWAKFALLLGGSHKLAKYKENGSKTGCPPSKQSDHFDAVVKSSNDRKVEVAASSECANSQWP